MASRSLKDLHPETRAKAEKFLELCKDAGMEVLIYCTYRSNEEQADLYAIGRTKSGDRVTNAKPGESAHNAMSNGVPASRAFDGVPLRHGKPVWSEKDAIWLLYGKLGEKAELQWAGRWKSMREFPHLQDA